MRDRAGLTPITSVYPNASVDELIELCRKERRVELAFERHRYFDTRTWMIAEQTDNGPMYGMDATCPLEGSDTKVTPDGFWKEPYLKHACLNPTTISIRSLSVNWIVINY